MKRIVLVALILTSALWLFALRQEVVVDSCEVHLKMENIELRDVKFYSGDAVVATTKGDGDFSLQFVDGFVVLSASSQTPITLKLPKDKTYYIKQAEIFCTFTNKTCFISTPGEKIVSNDEGIVVEDIGGHSKVIINDEGIFVHEGSEFIKITDAGINIEDGDEDTNFNGFLGVLTGHLVRGTVSAVMACLGNTTDDLVKAVVNDQWESCKDDHFQLNINF